ncbi:MAG: ABC transporter ATP-binding protein [Candidatus Pacebacteria bacterium]|jgi:putative ABC transport system ATP-binding protein|nr:ABC transporter ATP-binding protein [Candidatus Paceibacterota bacterium]MBT3512230.1 ABC transporter ATP-binding protein [Candidatus Paceibacterota bacterium]MBT4004924.1 ABC transporter ATP-binding protein [Candidatus Paceibacterota bacterium]MBT4358910.1 ABC transporter ATP-binding protein [Candidatus Paceibacterota bacterium]MBT4680768.1 ABC transporter ATP-binding protein [Candidatus Paceibacterota bacterium]
MLSQKQLIDFKNITKTYVTGPVKYQALKGVSFSINKGEFVSIMGPSGSGKSTVMNIMGALDTSTTGEYLLKNKNISNYDNDELAEIRNQEIGFVFQSFNLLPRTTVMENVKRPMMYAHFDKNKRDERALEKLRLVGLEDKVGNLSNHLSGGQIQRVAIARSLVMNPSIILADEPTGNLDSKTAAEIMGTLVELNQQGVTVIVITHEEEIAGFSKRVIKLKDGLISSDKKVRRK